ncbi:hypothetical protein CDD80_7093 [Ophiocordyceps camponoti-rufipedis]|uniref:Uncharacterized protein n=1 Tax=Ophiocordyceps camponoti-rufipedis TaxID=2004952 RepID=A0A2C5YPM6_9HYPO|nr:hypothetical protein CDD80_7093 [Ophiocordyceps camponoti-rufipedis]
MGDRPRQPEAPTSRARATAAARANLFRSQLTRRPTVSSTASVETLRLDVDVLSDTSEIVVRNQQGEVELADPPALSVEQQQQQQTEHHLEMEREKQRVADAVKHHAASQSSVAGQSEELLEAVRAELRAKVNALAEDNWMFEPEDATRG